jgi:hypothetical protein
MVRLVLAFAGLAVLHMSFDGVVRTPSMVFLQVVVGVSAQLLSRLLACMARVCCACMTASMQSACEHRIGCAVFCHHAKYFVYDMSAYLFCCHSSTSIFQHSVLTGAGTHRASFACACVHAGTQQTTDCRILAASSAFAVALCGACDRMSPLYMALLLLLHLLCNAEGLLLANCELASAYGSCM